MESESDLHNKECFMLFKIYREFKNNKSAEDMEANIEKAGKDNIRKNSIIALLAIVSDEETAINSRKSNISVYKTV